MPPIITYLKDPSIDRLDALDLFDCLDHLVLFDRFDILGKKGRAQSPDKPSVAQSFTSRWRLVWRLRPTLRRELGLGLLGDN
ncbi:hypothetical protein [Rubellicoccus peritrichatus]|uniref:Uncharacterized protein n=1 Tax=Rubellicoccus peritrichatus TaxID=3080537 RepID=A0AAQ3QU84_9BACT|nr:hypothetical protein [Puniceicoccus sp. CR14]WOO39720.1 hypothetical protein RZN69_13940 [Puniceicoccus sp. CR14]